MNTPILTSRKVKARRQQIHGESTHEFGHHLDEPMGLAMPDALPSDALIGPGFDVGEVDDIAATQRVGSSSGHVESVSLSASSSFLLARLSSQCCLLGGLLQRDPLGGIVCARLFPSTQQRRIYVPTRLPARDREMTATVWSLGISRSVGLSLTRRGVALRNISIPWSPSPSRSCLRRQRTHDRAAAADARSPDRSSAGYIVFARAQGRQQSPDRSIRPARLCWEVRRRASRADKLTTFGLPVLARGGERRAIWVALRG